MCPPKVLGALLLRLVRIGDRLACRRQGLMHRSSNVGDGVGIDALGHFLAQLSQDPVAQCVEHGQGGGAIGATG